MKLKIIKDPNPILRQKAAKIKDPLAKKIQELILNMFEILHLSKGIGLAAPQVGKSLRLCIIEVEGVQYALINPKITAKSRKKVLADEGCLSFPGQFFQISRYSDVQVRYTDKNGKPGKIKGQGLLARALQHEIDHLDGILFIDKIKKKKITPKPVKK
jgi:peptide deformylase